MASQLIVIDAAFKRAQIKVTPQTYLSDVLDEACKKLGYKPDQYTLKHNNKNIDLSRNIRLSGLPNAAKLSLVQASKSPSVVSVALQLPADGQQASSPRLTDKFPSDTSIWQILRRFEAGAAGAGGTSQANHNFTQRATPQMSGSSTSGSGRLCYEMPVVNAMGREMASFVDLQKTLGQLGFNSGTCLLRLSFRNTEKPLEEAMSEITQYFKDIERPEAQSTSQIAGAHEGSVAEMQLVPAADEAPEPDTEATGSPPDRDVDMTDASTLGNAPMTTSEAAMGVSPQSTSSTVPHDLISDDPEPPIPKALPTQQSQSSISIFAPPTSSTPASASHYNESDYIPTAAHALGHQARLSRASQNKKLLSDDELQSQAQAQQDALKAVNQVVVRIRFPDNAQAQNSFGQNATTRDLYELCRELMERPNDEAFSIRHQGIKGTETLPEGEQKLILDLGWKGRVLVTVVWGDGVSRSGPVLKEVHRERAQELRVEQPKFEEVEDVPVTVVQEDGSAKGKGKSGGDKESKMKSLLSRLSKK